MKTGVMMMMTKMTTGDFEALDEPEELTAFGDFENSIVEVSRLDFAELYKMQLRNQENFVELGSYDKFIDAYFEKLPVDCIGLFSYHVQQLMSEVGELLDADKRWKNFRNDKYDAGDKLLELADCFIELFNIAIFSEVNATELYNAISMKMLIVADRINESVEQD
jgi:hypothetical protein